MFNQSVWEKMDVSNLKKKRRKKSDIRSSGFLKIICLCSQERYIPHVWRCWGSLSQYGAPSSTPDSTFMIAGSDHHKLIVLGLQIRNIHKPRLAEREQFIADKTLPTDCSQFSLKWFWETLQKENCSKLEHKFQAKEVEGAQMSPKHLYVCPEVWFI